MNKATAITLAAACLTLAACAAKPIAKGDSTVQRKTVSIPKQGQQVHAVTGGLVHLKADYESSYAFKLVRPLSMGFMLGILAVSNEHFLAQASLDGEDVFCTINNVYADPLIGRPTKKACFQSVEKGKFNGVKVAPGEVWFSKEISPPIEYVSTEIPKGSGGKPLKRELIFEGGQAGTLLFSEKIYEQSVEAPTKAKPLIAKVESVPSKIVLDGVEVNVIAFTNNSLTYSIEKPWD